MVATIEKRTRPSIASLRRSSSEFWERTRTRLGFDHHHADHPYASCCGKWQMNVRGPGVSKVSVVVFTLRAGSDTSFGRSPWTASVPARWRAWKASSPMSHSWSMGSSLTSCERYRHAHRNVDLRLVEVRVVDPDRDMCRQLRGTRGRAGSPRVRRAPLRRALEGSHAHRLRLAKDDQRTKCGQSHPYEGDLGRSRAGSTSSSRSRVPRGRRRRARGSCPSCRPRGHT